MNLNAGDRIGYRGQTQYNEKYDEDGPDIMDNPQPLAHTTYNPRELELNVNGKSFTACKDQSLMDASKSSDRSSLGLENYKVKTSYSDTDSDTRVNRTLV